MATKRPAIMVMENVPELVEAANGANMVYLVDAANTLGYSVGFRILTAADYFCPQIRRRVFIVAAEVEASGLSVDGCKMMVEGCSHQAFRMNRPL